MKTLFANGRVIGNYRIVRYVGCGSHGQVFEVEHLKLGVRRAMKVLVADENAVSAGRERFMAESRVLARLDNPRVVRVHDLDVDSATGIPYFVMEYISSPDGIPRNLVEACRAGLGERMLLGWFADICEGLDYLHGMGIAHGDVTLGNVLVAKDGRVVISDFGLSRLFDDALGRDIGLVMPTDEFDAFSRVGTMMYLAPEQKRSDGAKVSPATDAWSLGILMFRLLTGHWFDPAERDAWLASIEDYDCPWRRALEKLLSPDPAERIPKGGLSELARLMAANYVPIQDRSARRIRRRCITAACAFAIAATIAAAFVAHRAPTPQRGETPAIAASLAPEVSGASRWNDGASAEFSALDNCFLFDSADACGGEIAQILRMCTERRQAGWGYRIKWYADRNERIRKALPGLSPAMRMLAAGELYRQSRMDAPHVNARAEVANLADALVGLALSTERPTLWNDEWTYETLLSDALTDEPGVWERLESANPEWQRGTSPWLLEMQKGDRWLGMANRVRGGRAVAALLPENAKEYVRCLDEARCHYAAAAQMDPLRHASARRMLQISEGDPESALRWFEKCRTFRSDDLTDFECFAMSLLPKQGEAPTALEAFLAETRKAGGEGTWTEAFSVLGRWRVLARYAGAGGWDANADRRAQSFADDAVRGDALAIVRKTADSDILKNAPEMRRHVVLADFAAIALACGDEALAGELVSRIPEDRLIAVLLSEIGPGTECFRRLSLLYSRGGTG